MQTFEVEVNFSKTKNFFYPYEIWYVHRNWWGFRIYYFIVLPDNFYTNTLTYQYLPYGQVQGLHS